MTLMRAEEAAASPKPVLALLVLEAVSPVLPV
jgi:hypothetical protein